MKIWIYLNGMQQGPYSYDELQQLPISADTPVWYDGLPDWTAAGTAPATAPLFAPGQAQNPQPQQWQQPAQQWTQPGQQWTQPQQQWQQPQQAWTQQQWQQQPQPAPAMPPRPATYLIWSILLTVLCCNPFSIAGIVTGAMTNSRYNSGDYDGATRMSHITEWMVILAIVAGVLIVPLSIIMMCS